MTREEWVRENTQVDNKKPDEVPERGTEDNIPDEVQKQEHGTDLQSHC